MILGHSARHIEEMMHKHQKQQLKLKDLIQNSEEKEMQECTFKPKINDNAR